MAVATKRSPERTDDAYWSDTEFDRVVAVIKHDLAPAFALMRRGGTVVCPTAGLVTGRAELPDRAPRVFAELRQCIIRLKRLGAMAAAGRVPQVLDKRDFRGPLPPNARYCGRPSTLGNPFVMGRDGTRDEVCDKYEAWLPTQPKLMAMIPDLAGQDLVLSAFVPQSGAIAISSFGWPIRNCFHDRPLTARWSVAAQFEWTHGRQSQVSNSMLPKGPRDDPLPGIHNRLGRFGRRGAAQGAQ